MEDKTVQPQENDKAAQEKDSRKPTIFRMVFSSILGAVIGSVPGVLMSLLSKKGSHMDKFSGHTTMIGGMIGAMVGHDLVREDHAEQLKSEKTKESRER
jgi:uncharacterized membrane protein YeaQ/YmgE (transglycosylase-associated protein family)